ncbi:hypothetical protein AXF42_Ash014271 [Apostasia shenzhenica]|uniref:DUF1677 domain-containing protein n=1 Tax=Apostasia shenzhenica TaxID=1088818 RepID=A0A2I0A1F7_9ASPA|nr:hypothetical protein AXF42_Ash014271 [Apostasia shenzhenica]
MFMETDSAVCECCGLREECTQEYISVVKSEFEGKWLCGLCAEAVRDEMKNGRKKGSRETEEALKAHMAFCRKFNSNPAVGVADGMRQMLRRRSGDLSSSSEASVCSSPKKFDRSSSASLQ